MLCWAALCFLLPADFLLSALLSSLSVQPGEGRMLLLLPLTQPRGGQGAAAAASDTGCLSPGTVLLSSCFQPAQLFCANTFVVICGHIYSRSHQFTRTELLLSVNEWVYVTLSKQLPAWSQKCRMQKNQKILVLCSFLFISLPRGFLVIHIMLMQNLMTLVVQSQNLTH